MEFEYDFCRFCGNKKLNNSLIGLTVDLIRSVQQHCQVILEVNKKLPQSVCLDCSSLVKNWIEFSEKLVLAQSNFRKTAGLINDIDKIQDEFKTELNNSEGEEDILVKRDNDDSNPEVKTQRTRSEHSSITNLNNIQHLYDETVVFVEENKILRTRNESTSSESNSSNVDTSINTRAPKRKKTLGSNKKLKNINDEISFVEDIEDCMDLDIPQKYKNIDGTINPDCYEQFENERWCDRKMVCLECNQESDNVHLLMKHYKKNHFELNGNEKYNCEDCQPETNIYYFNKFVNHVTGSHKKFLKHCCLICSDIFWNLNSLNEHFNKSHDKELEHINLCVYCGKYYKNINDLRVHESTHHNVTSPKEEFQKGAPQVITVDSLFAEELKSDLLDQKNIFELSENEKNADGTVIEECQKRFEAHQWSNLKMSCHECFQEIPSVFQLSIHYQTHHSEKKTCQFVCKHCPETKTFSNMESYINHAFTIHYEHLRYSCFICDSMHWNFKSLYYHYKADHSKIRIHICLYCGKHHKSGYDLKCHKDVHFPKKVDDSTPNFKCPQCPKVYHRKHQLTRHLDFHNNTKSFVCEICGKSFNSKATLINHKMVHSDKRDFKCDVCSESFKNKYKLKFHKTIHTDQRDFECEICNQRFRAKGTLKGHYLKHTGEKPFACEYCEKKFSAKHDLVVHTRLHTGEYTHECNVCGERYPSWSNYSKHMKGRHQIDVRSEKKKKYETLHKKEKSEETTGSSKTFESSSTTSFFYPHHQF